MAHALVWFRRDLRLADNPALQAALDAGFAPVPIYVHAPEEDGAWPPGAASRAWLHRSLHALDDALTRLGSRLIVRDGASLAAIGRLCEEVGDVEAVFWNRLYEPDALARDRHVEDALARRGLRVQTFNAALLVEPWTIANRQGDPYRVFTPYWREATSRLGEPAIDAAPRALPAPPAKLATGSIDALGLAPRRRWDAGFWTRWKPGERGALAKLREFIDEAAAQYLDARDFPGRAGTSRLSPHLHWGEISPRQVRAALADVDWSPAQRRHVDRYVRELGWREFSHHLLYHFPNTPTENLNPAFDALPWKPRDDAVLDAWRRGRTGVPIVDAGMRELWVTGWMHNRVRMLVASFLTRNLRQHWLAGARWFWDTLVDADLANNTQGWQWIAGTGADAAPYFRIFNPVTQGRRFDGQARYVRRWMPELAPLPDDLIHAPWTQPERLAACAPDYPREPVVDLMASRDEALAAYRRMKRGG